MIKAVLGKKAPMRARALLAATLVMLLFFSLAGWALHRAFANSVDQSAKNALQAYVVTLLSTMEFRENNKVVFETLPLPELALANSGVYAEIWSEEQLLWRSDSLIGKPLPKVGAQLGEYRFFPVLQQYQQYVLSLLVDWQEDAISRQFKVVVAVDSQTYQQQLQGYDRTLLGWLFALGLLLILFQLLLFTWLFRPLSRVILQLRAIERGEKPGFDEDFPAEVSVLTGSLNDYIEHEKRQIQKQKDSFANLAHSLKTPLAVIRASINPEHDQAELIEQQLDNMSNSIEYQLNKASTIARRRYSTPIQCAGSIKRVVAALQTLFKDKGVQLTVKMNDDVSFQGEEGDLLEVVGNLLENACKWCDKHVLLRVYNRQNGPAEEDGRFYSSLCIEVIDDGPGIDPDQRESILKRGKRLDEQVQGHGIGASIVADIVDAYDGQLSMLDGESNKVELAFEPGLKIFVSL